MAKRKTQQRSGGERADLLAKLSRPAAVLDEDAVARLLRATVEREGSQSAFARRYGIERSRLNKTLRGKRPVGPLIVRTLGLRRVYVAE